MARKQIKHLEITCDRCGTEYAVEQVREIPLTIGAFFAPPKSGEAIRKDFDLCADCCDEFRSWMDVKERGQ